MKRDIATRMTVEGLMEALRLPIEQQVSIAFSDPHQEAGWKRLNKKIYDGGWLFECQVSTAKPVCIMHGASLAPEQLLPDVKKIVYLMSRNPDQNELYLKEEWTTNFQDMETLLKVYHPKTKGVLSDNEMQLIHQLLHLGRRDLLDLRNLRDFTVIFLGQDTDKEQIWENMDKMSAITAVIDQKIWELGGEV